MYLLSFLAVVIVSFFTMQTTVGWIADESRMYLWFDQWSFIMLIVLCIPILIGSGLFMDFNNAFRLAVRVKERKETETETKKKGKKEVSLSEVKHAIEAVTLVRKVLLAGGTFIVLLTFIAILACLDPNKCEFWINMSIAILPLLYAVTADIFLLPIEARLKIRLNDMMHQ